MGGLGSGWHGRRSAKVRVEDCDTVLDVRLLQRHGLFGHGPVSGVLNLCDGDGAELESIPFAVQLDDKPTLVVSYGGYDR